MLQTKYLPIHQDIETIILDFVKNKENFSAYDVTSKLRKNGFWVEHKDIKTFVHHYMKSRISKLNYTSDNNGKYILYKPTNVVPLISKFTTTIFPTTLTSNTKEFISDKRVCSSYPNGRFYVPPDICKSSGLNIGDRVFISGSQIQKLHNNFIGNLSMQSTYIVDKDNALRISGRHNTKTDKLKLTVNNNIIEFQPL